MQVMELAREVEIREKTLLQDVHRLERLLKVEREEKSLTASAIECLHLQIQAANEKVFTPTCLIILVSKFTHANVLGLYAPLWLRMPEVL